MTASTHQHTTGYVHLGLKNRLKLLLLALSIGRVAAIHTRYKETITLREVTDSPGDEEPGDDVDPAEEDSQNWILRLIEWLLWAVRGILWICLVIEVVTLNGGGVLLTLLGLWGSYVLVGRVVEMEFGKTEEL